MPCKSDYIAVFDSGVGGVSVLRHLRRMLPGEHFLYYGDDANAPYGACTTERGKPSRSERCHNTFICVR